MKKIIFLTIVLSFINVFNANADEACNKDQILVKVNGLVCDFCARALEKTFGKRDDVSSISVDLDKGQVVINKTPDSNISDDVLKQIISDSGYNVSQINIGC